jgi:hypothetical protein
MAFGAINSSTGQNLAREFEDRFRQQQNPFQGAGGSVGGLFGGTQRNTGGGFDFSNFSEDQFEFSRGAALDQFFDPTLSNQQGDAVGAVKKNRIARGIRGRAADAAAGNTEQRFLEGNQRAALDFIKQDLNRGIGTDSNINRNNTAAQNLGFDNRGLTDAEGAQVTAQISGANLLSRNNQFTAEGTGGGGGLRGFAARNDIGGTSSAGGIAGFLNQGVNTEGGDIGGLLDQFVGNPNQFDQPGQQNFNQFDKLATLLGIGGDIDAAGLQRPGLQLQNTLEQRNRALPDQAPQIGTSVGGLGVRAPRPTGASGAERRSLQTNLFSPFQF